MSNKPDKIEQMIKLGTVLSTYVFFIWFDQDKEQYQLADTVIRNYQTLCDFLNSLNISVTVPNPLDKERIRDFMKSLEMATLLDRIQNAVNFSYGTQYGTVFLLVASATMYGLQSQIRADAALGAVRNDIRKIASDIRVPPSVVEKFLEYPREQRDDFLEAIKNACADKITVLFLAANPRDSSRIRLDEEFREIDEQIRLSPQREQFELALPQLALRPKDIARVLLERKPQIVHFSGHGTSRGELCFEDESGRSYAVQPEALAALFKQFTGQVECVILNACYTENQAIAIAKHIDYVIGMRDEINDKAAVAFSLGFYLALGAGKTIEEAFEFGRIQIMLHGVPEHLVPVLIKKSPIQP